MNVTKVRSLLGIAVASLAFASSVSAQPYRMAGHHHRDSWRSAAPSADAVELNEIAPLARRSTALDTFGDAAFARAQAQCSEDGSPAQGAPPYLCDPRLSEPRGYTCADTLGRLGYGQFYAFTPAYVSAPQTLVMRDASRQSSILPPATGLAWALNGLRFDPY